MNKLEETELNCRRIVSAYDRNDKGELQKALQNSLGIIGLCRRYIELSNEYNQLKVRYENTSTNNNSTKPDSQ